MKWNTANNKAPDPALIRRFYGHLLGLGGAIDGDWDDTSGSPDQTDAQLHVTNESGSDTVVPDVSIEVEDLDAVLGRVNNAGIPIEYGPIRESWGVRRFLVRDPLGTLVNVVEHE